MGNCCVSCRTILPSCVKDAALKQGKVFQIVKPDGKMLEFTSPTLVKDVLVDFSGFVIGLSQDDASQHLPPNFELKMGKVYYMLPSLGSSGLPAADSFMEDSEKTGSSRRVRIILTKNQLQQLLAKQVSMEELIMQRLEKTLCSNLDSSSATWKPALAAIPEGVE